VALVFAVPSEHGVAMFVESCQLAAPSGET
jgi:hypothetical protein